MWIEWIKQTSKNWDRECVGLRPRCDSHYLPLPTQLSELPSRWNIQGHLKAEQRVRLHALVSNCAHSSRLIEFHLKAAARMSEAWCMKTMKRSRIIKLSETSIQTLGCFLAINAELVQKIIVEQVNNKCGSGPAAILVYVHTLSAYLHIWFVLHAAGAG